MNVEVITTDDLRCHRCLGALYLRVKLPHPRWAAQVVGEMEVTYSRFVTLCPVCDAHSPAAQGLLAFFAIYSQVTSETAEAFGQLVRHWIGEVGCPEPDPEALDREIQQWRDGEFHG